MTFRNVRRDRRVRGLTRSPRFALSTAPARVAIATAAWVAFGAFGCKRDEGKAVGRGERGVTSAERAGVRDRGEDARARGERGEDESNASAICAQDGAFGSDWPIEEASAAAEVPLKLAGDASVGRALVVVSDSGNHGALLVIPLTPEGAASPVGEARRVTLALDDVASDDVEGMAWREGALYTLTSSGAVRRFVADARGGFTRDGAAYPIAPPPLSCPRLTDVNCGKNYEGLCLRPASVVARCAGYAASKRDGSLHCVVVEGKKLRVDPVKPPIKLALPENALSDCAFGAEGGPAERTLVVTTNVHGGSKTYVVDEASGALARIDVPGHVNNEAVAIDARGALYQFQDDGRAPSAGSRAVCRGW